MLRSASAEGAAVVITLHNYRFVCLSATLFRDGHVCEDCLGRLPWPGVLHSCYHSRGASGTIAASLVVHRAARTFDRVALYLAVSEFVRDRYLAAGFRADPVKVKHNFAWPMPRRQGPGGYLLFLGRLSSEKGVSTIVQAARKVPAPLLVVGDGPEAERLRSLAPPNVEFRGTVQPSQVPALFQGARALLVPSVCYEGAPRSIIEAHAAGVPVIASQIGALPDMVADATSGLVVPPGEPEAWAEAIRTMLDDRTSEEFGRNALRIWEERYTPAQSLRGLETAYQEALMSR